MIIDNFGTIRPNPYRWYRPRIITPIVDEAQNLAEIEKWVRSPHIMVLPEPTMSGVERVRAAVRDPDYLARVAADSRMHGLVEVDNPMRREVRPRRGTRPEWPTT